VARWDCSLGFYGPGGTPRDSIPYEESLPVGGLQVAWRWFFSGSGFGLHGRTQWIQRHRTVASALRPYTIGRVTIREQFVPQEPRFPREIRDSALIEISKNPKILDIYRREQFAASRKHPENKLFFEQSKTTSQEKTGRIRHPCGNNFARRTPYSSRKMMCPSIPYPEKPQFTAKTFWNNSADTRKPRENKHFFKPPQSASRGKPAKVGKKSTVSRPHIAKPQKSKIQNPIKKGPFQQSQKKRKSTSRKNSLTEEYSFSRVDPHRNFPTYPRRNQIAQ
jgi:hypothetical protein